MDYNQAPCGDYGGGLPHTTGEYRIPWPPVNVHRHPSTYGAPLAILGCAAVLLIWAFFGMVGVWTVWQWL